MLLTHSDVVESVSTPLIGFGHSDACKKLNLSSQQPDQVFIVGMNGSGTTMLLDHLSSHRQLFGFPSETKILPYFLAHQSKYGDLAIDRNYLKLWRDMGESIAGRRKGADGGFQIPADWSSGPRSAAHVFDRIMRVFASYKNKSIWCEKSPMHVLHLSLLGNAFPNAKFIHVIRDGRDCAASFHRRWQFNPRRTIVRWKHAVRKGQLQGASLGSRYMDIRYESLTSDPEGSLRAICQFLGVEFDNSVLAAGRSRTDIASSKATNIVQNQRSAGNYFEQATLDELEQIAGRYLTELGYQAANRSGDSDPSRVTLRWWELGDEARRLSVVVFRGGRIFKPGSWGYLARRVGSALKQKATLGVREDDRTRVERGSYKGDH